MTNIIPIVLVILVLVSLSVYEIAQAHSTELTRKWVRLVRPYVYAFALVGVIALSISLSQLIAGLGPI